jgi:hypothetical protein
MTGQAWMRYEYVLKNAATRTTLHVIPAACVGAMYRNFVQHLDLGLVPASAIEGITVAIRVIHHLLIMQLAN